MLNVACLSPEHLKSFRFFDKSMTRKLETILFFSIQLYHTEAAIHICFTKWFFWKTSQIKRKTCNGVLYLIKLQAKAATFLKIELHCKCFPIKFAKCFRRASLSKTFRLDCFKDDSKKSPKTKIKDVFPG